MRQAAWPHAVSGPWSPGIPDVNSRCQHCRHQSGVSDMVEVVHEDGFPSAVWAPPFPLPSSSSFPSKQSACWFLGLVSERRCELEKEGLDGSPLTGAASSG